MLSASRPDRLIANSRFTAQRIARYWGRSATVLPPPVDVERFDWQQPRDDFYLSVCRLVPYKRVDPAGACRELDLPLVVVVMARSAPGLRRWRVRPLGSLVAPRLTRWSSCCRCRAYVYAGLEDFGIAPVEAMASARRWWAWARRPAGFGALPKPKPAQATGLLFAEQQLSAVKAALEAFESNAWAAAAS